MLEMIHERRSAEKKEERYDLFSSLLDANEQEPGEGEVKLSDRELIGKSPGRDCFTESDESASTQGNTFIFLLAGERCVSYQNNSHSRFVLGHEVGHALHQR